MKRRSATFSLAIFYGLLLCSFSGSPSWAGLELSLGGTFPRDVEMRALGSIAKLHEDWADYSFTSIHGEFWRISLPPSLSPEERNQLEQQEVFVKGELRKDLPFGSWLSVNEIRQATEEDCQQLTYLPSQHPAKLVKKTGDDWVIAGVRSGPSGRPGKDPALDSYRFDKVVISPQLVKDVFIGVQTIPPFFRHAFLVFTFQERDDSESFALVLSIEPLKKPNETKPLKDMLRGELPIVYQLCTWEDYTTYNCERWSQKLDMWKMNFPMGQMTVRKWLDIVLQASVRPRLSERYNMNTNNCSSSILTMLVDELDSEESEPLRDFFKGLLIVTNPRRLSSVLHKCKIIDEKKRIRVTKDNYAKPLGQLLQ